MKGSKVARIGLLITLAAGGAAYFRGQADADQVAVAQGKGSETIAAAKGGFTSILPARPAPAEAMLAAPDHGSLLVPGPGKVEKLGPYTWHPVLVSEAHAMAALSTRELVVTAPDGSPIRLRYDRHLDHGDGNWSWIGRPEGAQPGEEAIFTFGEKAAFGTIPWRGHSPLRLTSMRGRAYLVDTDAATIGLHSKVGAPGNNSDIRRPPTARANRPTAASGTATATPQGAPATAAAASTPSRIIDVVFGYTNGFASRLGGQSQAVTRLTFLATVANTTFANSNIDGEVRIAGTVMVNYDDATSNEVALYALSGKSCTETTSNGSLSCVDAPVPAALQPLTNARASLGADTMSLVRNFDRNTNGGCGIAWLIGAGLSDIVASDAEYASSVVSDSNGSQFPSDGYICRDESFAHELGHNLGSAHDAATADGDDNVLQADEYGRFPYSFGYKTPSDAGNFYTIMAYGDSGQTSYRVFSNPRITTCGNRACGTADADNAQSINNTISTIAAFRAAPTTAPGTPGDVNNDGKSDLLWYHAPSQTLAYWVMNGATTTNSGGQVLGGEYRALAYGDFNGDHQADVLARGPTNNLRLFRSSGGAFVGADIAEYPSGWEVTGTGDVSGDGISDIVWYHAPTRTLAYWVMQGQTVMRSGGQVLTGDYVALNTGDYNGDGLADVLARGPGGDLRLFVGNGSAFVGANVGAYPSGWEVVGSGDVDGDGKSDVVWYHAPTRTLAYWILNGTTVVRSNGMVLTGDYTALAVGDYNGDHKADVLSRGPGGDLRLWTGDGNLFTGANVATYPSGWKIIGTRTKKPALDVDNDGRSDLAWFHAPSNTLAYWVMNSASVMRNGGQSLDGAALGTGDFNGDGIVDVLANAPGGRLKVWIGNGSVFTGADAGVAPAGWTFAGSSDIDNDQKADAVWFHASSATLAYWVMNGASVTRTGGQALEAGAILLGAGDYNGDGLADVVTRNAAGAMRMWIGNGSVFTSSSMGTYPAGWTFLDSEDVDNDGRSDLMFFHAPSRTLGYWIMNGPTVTRSGGQVIGGENRVIAVGDYNGDGLADVFTQGDFTSMLSFWRGNGSVFSATQGSPYPNFWEPLR